MQQQQPNIGRAQQKKPNVSVFAGFFRVFSEGCESQGGKKKNIVLFVLLTTFFDVGFQIKSQRLK